MAKNINIETINGTFTLTASSKAKVYAVNGVLNVDLGEGNVKQYPLSSILGWSEGVAERKGQKLDRLTAACNTANEKLAAIVVEIKNAASEGDDDLLLTLLLDYRAAADTLDAANEKLNKFRAWVAKAADRKAVRLAKKSAASLASVPQVDPVVAPVIAPPARKSSKKSTK